MPVDIAWDNDEHTIIRYQYVGRWSLEDHFAAQREVSALLDTVEHRVHTIVDLRESRFIPNVSIEFGKQAMREIHPNTHKVVFVAAPLFVERLLGVLMRVARGSRTERDIMFVRTLREAYDFLAALGAAVPPPEPAESQAE